MIKISTVDRRAHILKLIEDNGSVDVVLLSKKFNVSEVTIRKDLKHFEKRNLIVRSRGGASKQTVIDVELPIIERRKQNTVLKQKIGNTAAQLIMPGETVLLDSGTTVMELVKNFPKQNETSVITNAIDIAYRLAEYPKVKVMVPGGILRRNSLSLVGEQAAATLRDFFCDKCFIGADGIDMERGLLTNNIEEAHLMRINIKNAKKVIVLADSSKFKTNGVMTIAPITDIHMIITDSAIPEEAYKHLVNLGIEVVVVY